MHWHSSCWSKLIRWRSSQDWIKRCTLFFSAFVGKLEILFAFVCPKGSYLVQRLTLRRRNPSPARLDHVSAENADRPRSRVFTQFRINFWFLLANFLQVSYCDEEQRIASPYDRWTLKQKIGAKREDDRNANRIEGWVMSLKIFSPNGTKSYSYSTRCCWI